MGLYSGLHIYPIAKKRRIIFLINKFPVFNSQNSVLYIFLILFLFPIQGLFSQSKDQIQNIYNHLAQKDIYNSHELLHFVDSNILIKDEFSQTIVFNKIYDYTNDHPNNQVLALVLALDDYLSADRYNVKSIKVKDLSKSYRAVKIAMGLKNDLLLACIYNINGNTFDLLHESQNALFYFKKAFNILKDQPQNAYYLYESNYFDITKELYQLYEYKNCISFGIECLKLTQNPLSTQETIYQIYLLDLIGASYKKLSMPDSSIYYYRKLQSLLDNSPLQNEYQNQLWKSIVTGNIGENLLNKNLEEEASPFIWDYYNFNQQHDDIYNRLLSANLYARLLATKGKSRPAINLWKSVLLNPAALRKADLVINASKGLSDIYAQNKLIDSALIYQKLFLQTEESVNLIVYNSGLKAAETQIDIEKMEMSLKHSEQTINSIKKSKKLTLIAFILAFLLILFISFSAIYRARLAQIKNILLIRNKISADIHDEVGSTLSSISFYTAALLHEHQDKQDREILLSIQDNAQKVQESLSDIVWSIKPDIDDFDKLLTRMRVFGGEMCEVKNILFHLNAIGDFDHIIMGMENRRNLYLIFKESINNAVKYSNCTSLNVEIEAKHRVVKRMIILDDGEGFDIEKSFSGNGLINMRRRAADMGGNLEISSGEKLGCEVKLTL